MPTDNALRLRPFISLLSHGNPLLLAAAVVAIIIMGGCVRHDEVVPDPSEQVISFSVGSVILKEDVATKSTTESFTTNGESFAVFGERVTSSDEHSAVMDNISIVHHYAESDDEPPVVTEDYWGYETPSSVRYWYWTSMSERYDFVAVSPAGKGTVNEHASGNISVSTHYDYLTGAPAGGDKYDILAATYRRSGSDWEHRFNRVELSFSHMGSAVAVTVINNSQSTSVPVNYIQYKNLIVSADAKVTLDNLGRSFFRWTNLTPSASAVRKLAKTPVTTIGPGITYTGEYQIMIPQNLSLYGATLVLNYSATANPEEDVAIPLAGITRADGTAITSWEIGYKYNYYVSMRLDGGLRVTVTTTPWDEPVEGETPGILI